MVFFSDGFESQFAVNHLGHFLLTNLLLDLVKKSAPARIVSVSSTAHNLGSIHWDDFKGEKSYIAWERYGQSKLANVLMVKELQRRLDEEGVDIVVNAVHPGTVRTDLGRHSLAWTVVCALFGWAFLKDVEQGASTTIYAAVHPDTAHSKAQYFADNAIGYPNAASQNMESAKRLWDVSVDMVKLEEALKDAQ
jgi:NAD(P)-dependent dehydrogenase (short-subunit alcohol dehydrogenase family)